MKKPGRIWFYRPQWYWTNPFPFGFGHDAYARKTVYLGWAITGEIVFAYKDCGDPECEADMLEMLAELAEIKEDEK